MDSTPRPLDRRAAGPRAAGPALLALLAVLGALPGPRGARGDPAAGSGSADESSAFFAAPACPRLKFVITPADYARLERDPREYVHCTLKENEKTVYEDVGVKLKGGASFRPIDQKPDMTVKVDKYVKEQAFHGLKKFHLNNSLQDPTLFCEFVGSETFQAAGMPTVRVTHARVSINERDLGLLVMLEAYDKPFLRRNFADVEGNLYDTTGGDIAGGAPKDVGKDKEDDQDLLDLAAACQEKDPAKARAEISKTLNVDSFLTFVALERMLCQWDGYCMGRNNYRVYIPKDGKAVFLPHGLDNLLQDASASILDDPPALVAKAVLNDPQWQAAYRKRVIELLPIFTKPERIDKRIDEEAKRTAAVSGGAPNPAQPGSVKGRFSARAGNLVEQSTLPGPKPTVLAKGGALRLRVWVPSVESGAAKLAQVNYAAERVYRAQCGPEGKSVASWHARVFLGAGTYRFEGSVQTDGLVAAEGPPKGGAGLSASLVEEGPRLEGTTAWKPLAVDFKLADPAKVDLSLDIRATKGVAMFRFGSLRVVRIE